MAYQTCNFTIPPEQCSPDTCCLLQGTVRYLPSLAGNSLFLTIFILLTIAQLALGIWYRTWGFMIGATSAGILEIIGYVGRILMHNDIFNESPFEVYIICLTIAPAFFTASIYLSLSRLITIHGKQYARFHPKVYTYMFITFDVIALVLQAVGGATTSAAPPTKISLIRAGINIMVGGLAWQLASLVIFSILCLDFAWRAYRKEKTDSNQHQRERVKGWKMLRPFEYSTALAVLLIIIRSAYRVAELEGGFDSSIANNQILFMIFEGPMVILAMGSLTVLHPGTVFGRGWGGVVVGSELEKESMVNAPGPKDGGESSDTSL